MGNEGFVILVIDDEPHVRSSVQAFLEDHDYTVLEAEDGHHGLQLFTERHPDLVLIDLSMPGMHGMDVLKTMVKDSPETPAIIVSGTGVIHDSIEALRLGAWDYVTKPIDDMSILLHVILKAREKTELIRQSQDRQKCLEQEVCRRTRELQETNKKLLQEITERKQAESKIIEYQQQLRSLVSQLTISEEQERKRIATELHDSIGQSLALTKMKVDEELSLESHEQPVRFLQEIQSQLERLIETAQRLTSDMASPALCEFGLEIAARDWLAREVEKKHQIATCVVDEGKAIVLDEDTKALLFRAVRELSINVVKHARASNLTVTLGKREDTFEICVADDGIGFDPLDKTGPSTQGGYGLFSIRERISHMGGTVIVQSKPTQGTIVKLQLPLSPHESVSGI